MLTTQFGDGPSEDLVSAITELSASVSEVAFNLRLGQRPARAAISEVAATTAEVVKAVQVIQDIAHGLLDLVDQFKD